MIAYIVRRLLSMIPVMAVVARSGGSIWMTNVLVKTQRGRSAYGSARQSSSVSVCVGDVAPSHSG